MFYVELLRIRTGLFWVSVGLVAVVLLAAAAAVVCAKCEPMNVSHSALPLAIIGYAASLGAAIFGSVFGGSLAAENDDHLPIALTRPAGREVRALGIIALDIAAVLAVFTLIYVAGLLVTWLLAGRPVAIALDGDYLLKLARFVAFPIAWFALTQGLSCGSRGSTAGMIIGPMWPVLEGLFALTLLQLAAPWRGILTVLNLPNPINYFPFWEFDEHLIHTYAFGYGVGIDTLALAAIACAGIVLATMRWRRVEA